MRGGQQQVLLLLKALRGAGHHSTLLAREDGPLSTTAAVQGFPVYAATTREVWHHSKDADLIHAHDARAHAIAAVASRLKFVVSRRVAFPVRRSVATAWKYHRAARFLAVSEFVAKQLERGGVCREKIDVVYDAVEPGKAAEEWRAEYPIVALASRDPQKGRDLVERAAEIAGVRVVFSKNLLQDLRRASMFLYITRSEGLGSAALLAMSMGVPLIASCVGGLTEVFEDGVSGVSVRNDAPEIAQAIQKILEQPAFAHTLIEKSRQRIEESFTLEHLLHKTLLSYRSALAL
jgi:hypothetical protein